MSDTDQNKTPNPLREIVKSIAITFLIVLIGMLVFESVYMDYVHQKLTEWEEHLLTILFSTLFACTAAFFALRKHQVLEKRLIQEIDERKQAEYELRQSENRYRTLIQNAPVCIHEIDLQGRIISMNPSGFEMMGVTDQNLRNVDHKHR